MNKIGDGVGIYYFEIDLKDFYKNIIDTKGLNSTRRKTREILLGELNKIWTDKTVRKETKYPKIIIKRFNKHYRLKPYVNKFESDEWIPLYIGISKNVNARLNEHLHCESDSTFSMKLSHLKNMIFRLESPRHFYQKWIYPEGTC